MRILISMALLASAAAFTPALPSLTPTATAARAKRSQAQGSSAGSLPITGAAAALALLGAMRPRKSQKVRSARKAEDYAKGQVDPETGEKNYVNPWEERIDGQEDMKDDARPFGKKFHPYTGDVYKKVPVVSGPDGSALQFPLDPSVYYPPLEPPKPGVKWGDGRAPDGNWYMEVDDQQIQYWQGVGKRKTACAIVRIVKGNGQFIVNGRDAIQFFNNYPIWWLKACEPLSALSEKNSFDIIAKSFGGGVSGQAGAIRLALARAMQEYNFNWRPLLKKAKYLTRDWRMVEPKKTGQPKARKKTPYHKR